MLQFVLLFWTLFKELAYGLEYPVEIMQHKGWSVGALISIHCILKAHLPYACTRALTQQYNYVKGPFAIQMQEDRDSAVSLCKCTFIYPTYINVAKMSLIDMRPLLFE